MKKAFSALLTTSIFALAQADSVLAQHTAEMPDDIHASSLSRLPLLEYEDLDAEGRIAYAYIVGDGEYPTTGPVPISMYSPTVAEAWHMLNNYLRFEGELEPRQYEVTILATAWEIEHQYEWTAHEALARRYEVPDEVIDTIKYGRPARNLSDEDTLLIEIPRQIMREHQLSSELYAAAVEHFGEKKMFELLSIVGNYAMVGIVMTGVNQQLPPDRPPTLPER
jgi:4-carboxymuconolactone decarboxylase